MLVRGLEPRNFGPPARAGGYSAASGPDQGLANHRLFSSSTLTSGHPQFDDGSQADEELTEYVVGSSFAYQLTGFTNVLSRLAAGIRGEFNVNPDGAGALIRWTYEFKPLPGRRWILAGPFAPLWRRYMVAALDRCVHVIETKDSSVQVQLRAG